MLRPRSGAGISKRAAARCGELLTTVAHPLNGRALGPPVRLVVRALGEPRVEQREQARDDEVGAEVA